MVAGQFGTKAEVGSIPDPEGMVLTITADIVAVEEKITRQELLTLLAEKQFSRIPVYRGSLDDVLGTIHIKDILACLAQNREITLADYISEVPVVSPSMPVLDLILEMRHQSRHMALVVDEYGGIDGLVTIGDIIESIVGDIADEHVNQPDPQLTRNADGTLLADARFDLETFEEMYGKIFSEEEHEESDTLGGLVCSIAGRVPARGEIILHDSEMVFEVLEADPRRVSLLRIRNIPESEKNI